MRIIPLIRGSRILAATLFAGLLLTGSGASPAGCPGLWRSAISRLASADDARVSDAIRLAAYGEAELALVRLDNGKQGSLQVWTAWALLQLGNRLGAFEGNACDRVPHRA
jgi:hypothetical protein